jgi:hypothetical protein
MALCWKYLVPLAFAFFIATAAFMWAARALPWLVPVARWSTFLVGGVALVLFFLVRVIASYRGSRLYDVGAR